ncbi:MAG: WG repeat-containing protein [Bacteroidetes bacterium]|nr:WG repeat-containing protein [Bacteroidota bacterium]
MKNILLSLVLITNACFSQNPKSFQDLNTAKWGIKSSSGTILVEPKYEDIRSYAGGLAIVKLNSKYGAIDITGKEIVVPKYEDMNNFQNGVCVVKENGKKGLIDKTGKALIETKYDHLIPALDNLYFVKIDKKHGVISEQGKTIIPIEYTSVEQIEKGIYMVNIKTEPVNGKYTSEYGLFSKTGQALTQVKYNRIDKINNWYQVTGRNGKLGYITPDGIEVIPTEYDFITPFNAYNFSKVEKDKKFGYVNKIGKVMIPCIYEDICNSMYSNNFSLFAAKLNNKWGFVDINGKEIIPFKYTEVLSEFKSGLTGAKLNEKWGYIDMTGKEVIPFKFDRANPFYTERAKVEVLAAGSEFDYDVFYINKNGEKIADK